MYKTFARKYRTTAAKIRKKYTSNGVFSVKYTLKSGVIKDLTFHHDGFKQKNPNKQSYIDDIPKFTYFTVKPTLIERLKSKKCEQCGATDTLTMHHVRKLKNLKGDNPCEKQMIARRRKTIALCSSCITKTQK